MADIMKIGGKTPSNTVAGVSVDADGKINTNRTWNTDIIQLFSDTVSDTNEKRTTNIDCSNYPIISLRITNRTGVPITITPLVDLYNNDNGYALLDKDGGSLSLDIPATNSFITILPTEVSWLNYVKYLRLKFVATDTPTASEPTVGIYAVVRK